MRLARSGAAAAALAALLCAGCGKPPAPKVDADAERAQATERAKQRAYGGTEVKALEDSRKIAEDMNRKAQEGVDRADKNAK